MRKDIEVLCKLNKLLTDYGNAHFSCGAYGLEEPDIYKPDSVEYEKLCIKTRKLKEEIIELFKGKLEQEIKE